jgi:membrane protease YdiL (CAAX protease family)
MRLVRTTIWLGLTALVVLATRTLVYALVPSPEARLLEHQAAGPTLPVLTGGALLAGLAISAAVVWLASLAVRERHLLSGEPGPAPRFSLRGLAISATALFVATSCVFTCLESYIHYRAGLGFHGLSCLEGPVHRNAVPILAALSLLAAALHAAACHVLASARRTIRLLRGRLMRLPRRRALPAAPLTTSVLSRMLVRRLGARGPPVAVSA